MLSVAPIGTPETAPALETTGRRSPLQVSAETLFPAVLAAAAFVVRLWPVWQVHFWDECVYLQNAEVLCCGKTNYSELSSRPPLLSLLFAVVFRVWHSAFAASLLTAALNALGPLFLFLSGRKLVSRTAAGIAALLLAFGPFFVNGNTGNSLLTDSPALTLILLSCWLTLEAAERNSAWWTGFAGFVGALAVLMRFASVPAIGMVSLLLLRRGRWLRAVVRFGIGFGVAIVPYLLWSKIGYGGFLTTLQRGWANVAGSSEPPAYYIQHFVEVFSWIAVAGLVLWFVRAVLDARAGQKPTWRDAFLWAWAVAMLAYFSSITHKELRYILPMAPAVLLLSGRGLELLVRNANLKFRAIGIAVLVVALGYSFAPDLERFRGSFVAPFISEEKDVSDLLNGKASRGAVLYTNFNSPVFAYYTSLPMRVLSEQDATFYKAFPANMPESGYFILYKQIDKEPRQDWVESSPAFRVFQEFPSLTVYEYTAGVK